MLSKIKNIPQVYLQNIASFLSIKINCSITIEATLSLSLAIFASTFMLGPMFIINSTIDIMNKTDNASRLLSYYDLIMDKYVRENNNVEHINIDLLNDTCFEFLNKINIPATIMGNFGLLSSIESENIILQSASDVKSLLYDNNHMINYDLYFIGKHPLNLWGLKNPEFRIINSRRAFVGVKGNRWNEKEDDGQIVYNVSDDSSVYHLTLNCTYLKKEINVCKRSEINSRSNFNGSKYTPCSTCIENDSPQNDYLVYFTKYGFHFHIKNNCSRLEPLIIRQISINKAKEKGLRVCSKCESTSNK
jgi:hypothetical protein